MVGKYTHTDIHREREREREKMSMLGCQDTKFVPKDDEDASSLPQGCLLCFHNIPLTAKTRD